MDKNDNFTFQLDFYEKQFIRKGYRFIAGVDEAGRGPLAGPVVAAAVILRSEHSLEGIRDSKKLTPQQRETLFPLILKETVSFGLGVVNERVIDYINIREASFKAMERAILNLEPAPEVVLVDGQAILGVGIPQLAICEGDNFSVSIASASIVAKVIRDRFMDIYDKIFPEYNFARNKGYGTEEHIEMIRRFGRSIIHRKTFQIDKWEKKELI